MSGHIWHGTQTLYLYAVRASTLVHSTLQLPTSSQCTYPTWHTQARRWHWLPQQHPPELLGNFEYDVQTTSFAQFTSCDNVVNIYQKQITTSILPHFTTPIDILIQCWHQHSMHTGFPHYSYKVTFIFETYILHIRLPTTKTCSTRVPIYWLDRKHIILGSPLSHHHPTTPSSVHITTSMHWHHSIPSVISHPLHIHNFIQPSPKLPTRTQT